MKSLLYQLLERAASLNEVEQMMVYNTLEASSIDPNESHQAGTEKDQRSLLELIARASIETNRGEDQAAFCRGVARGLLRLGADPHRRNAVGQSPDLFASTDLQALLMEARGASAKERKEWADATALVHKELSEKDTVLSFRRATEASANPKEILGAPWPVVAVAFATIGNGWIFSSPKGSKKGMAADVAEKRWKQLQNIHRWMKKSVSSEDSKAAQALLLAAVRGSYNQSQTTSEKIVQANHVWERAEVALNSNQDWETAARQAMDGRFGALTPKAAQAILRGNGPCTDAVKASLWTEGMAVLAQSPIDHRDWLEADNYRHLISDTRSVLYLGWEQVQPPEWTADTMATWERLFKAERGTELLVELVACTHQTEEHRQTNHWKNGLVQWLQKYPDQAPRVALIAQHTDAHNLPGFAEDIRQLTLDATLPMAQPGIPKPRF